LAVAGGGTGSTTSTGSGAVVLATSPTISAPTISGAGITFPYGSNPQAAPSKVLQVVSGTLTSIVSTSSLTYVTTGLNASITPLFSTSKILIIVSGWCDNNGTSGLQVGVTIFKNNATNLAGTSSNMTNVYSGTARVQGSCSVSYLDSPTTTSSTNYAVYFASSNGGGAVNFNGGTSTSSITLMEIAQ